MLEMFEVCSESSRCPSVYQLIPKYCDYSRYTLQTFQVLINSFIVITFQKTDPSDVVSNGTVIDPGYISWSDVKIFRYTYPLVPKKASP